MTDTPKVFLGAPSIRRRLASMIYEILLVFGLLAVTFLLPNTMYGIATHSTLPSWALLLYVFLVMACYFVWCWHRGGETLAMQTWKLRVCDAISGERPTMKQALFRYILCWPSLLFFGVGIIWAIFDRDKQFLHDRIARTQIRFNTLA